MEVQKRNTNFLEKGEKGKKFHICIILFVKKTKMDLVIDLTTKGKRPKEVYVERELLRWPQSKLFGRCIICKLRCKSAYPYNDNQMIVVPEGLVEPITQFADETWWFPDQSAPKPTIDVSQLRTD